MEPTELEKILLHYPDKDWDWTALSYNANISYQFILDHPEFPWDWKEVANNIYVEWDDIMENPKFWVHIADIDFFASPSPQLIWNDITTSKENHDKIDWDHLSDIIDIDVVAENMHLPWNWDTISYAVCEAGVIDYPNLPYNWELLSYEMTEKYIKEHPEKEWCWRAISFNDKISAKFIRENLDLSSFTNYMVKNNLSLKETAWYYPNLSCNPNMTWDLLLEMNKQRTQDYYWFQWDYGKLSENPGITWKDIRNNPDKPWNWSEICKNPNVTLDLIKRKPYLPWNYYSLSSNPNITLEFIKEHEDKNWNWAKMSGNEFNFEQDRGEYLDVANRNIKLDILCNNSLSKYLKMEILEEYTYFNFYQLSYIM